jgi:VCBS repeat-containing protein
MSQHHAWSTEAAREVHTTGKVSFLLLVENKGSTKETFDLEATEHEGWTVTLDKTVLNLAKGQNKVVILTIKSQDAAVDDSVNVKVTATAQDDMSALSIVEAHITVDDLGETKSIKGDQVSVYYVLVDRGDTTSFDENTWSINQHNTFKTEAGGSGSIPGFADGVVGMRVGETKSFLIPADQAYGEKPDSESSPVGDLFYEISLENIE